jgi:hypothetical protein
MGNHAHPVADKEGSEDIEGVLRASQPLNMAGNKDIEKEESATVTPSETDGEAAETPGTLGNFEGWDTADDKGNPRNWGFGKKIFHTAIPGLYGFVVYVLLFSSPFLLFRLVLI